MTTLAPLSEQHAYALAMQLIARAMMPDPPLWVDEWSELHMRIPSETGAAEPGPYRVARTPFAREVMRVLSPEHTAQRVVVMGASQLLKTQTFLNWCMAVIACAPANVIALEPSGELVKKLSARIDKTIKVVEPVRKVVAAPRSRDSKNTINAKDFKGGTLFCTTAGSAKNLAETSARYGYFDEIDRAQDNVQDEGDPVDLFENRFNTFGTRKKLYYTSSPLLEETSRIKQLYEQGDQRKYHVPCPHCGHKHELIWTRLLFDGVTARMACPECGELIEESHKPDMLAAGEWVATAPGDGGETVSFHISALYAPFGWVSWTALAKKHQKAAKAKEQGDDFQMQVFYNTALALPWSATKADTSAKYLLEKAQRQALPPRVVPKWALVITAAVDVQGDRLEAKALGWGEGMEHVILDKQIFMGSPAEPDVWNALDAWHRDTRYPRADGHMHQSIARMHIDSGGHHTQEVYDFCRRRRYRQVYAVKGASTPGKPIIARSATKVDVNWRGTTEKHGAEVLILGTDTAKEWIYARLKIDDGPGASHFNSELTEDDLEQIVAEYRVAKMQRGRKVVQWTTKKGVRNEGLDLYVYNLAAAYAIGLHKMTAAQWQALRDRIAPPLFDPANMPQNTPPAPSNAGDAQQSQAAPVASSRGPAPAPNPFASSAWSSRL